MMPDQMVAHAEWLAKLKLPTIVDHIARIKFELGTDQPAFRQLLDLAKRDHVWVKVSGADRQKSRGFPATDVAPYVQALAAVAPDRLIWGTDWPHGNIFAPNAIPNDGDLIDLLPVLMPDAAVRQKVLVENPARLFGFEP
jgi:predicted TIM-barrel fold metal-dependent hydrolase